MVLALSKHPELVNTCLRQSATHHFDSLQAPQLMCAPLVEKACITSLLPGNLRGLMPIGFGVISMFRPEFLPYLIVGAVIDTTRVMRMTPRG